MEANASVRSAVAASLAELNGVKGDPRSFDRLEKLLDDQAYRLSFWHVAADEINYRRFFDINELAAIRVEDPEVFEATHEFTLRLVGQGLVSGLRIDHVDGLLDPGQYLRTLQHECAIALGAAETALIPCKADNLPSDPAARPLPLYLVVEKILGADERLHRGLAGAWHDRLRVSKRLNGLFVESGNCDRLMEFYLRFRGIGASFPTSSMIARSWCCAR